MPEGLVGAFGVVFFNIPFQKSGMDNKMVGEIANK